MPRIYLLLHTIVALNSLGRNYKLLLFLFLYAEFSMVSVFGGENWILVNASSNRVFP